MGQEKGVIIMLDEFSKRRADKILESLERDFKNPSHWVAWEDMEVFIAAGATRVETNKYDDIYSYLHTVEYKGKKLFSSTPRQIAI